MADSNPRDANVRRVLSIDGGGLRGVFPAAFLAKVEEKIALPLNRCFDLVVGASTGGIIALAIGLGIPARKILQLYEEHGPRIFDGHMLRRTARQIFRPKYSANVLRDELVRVFDDARLADSQTRLAIPSCDLHTCSVHVWKTRHHPRFHADHRELVIDVALATAAAPTYFQAHRTPSGHRLLDGGIWANNPSAVALVESIGVLGWERESIRLLSIACPTGGFPSDWRRQAARGALWWGWKLRIINAFMQAQSFGAIGMTQHLLADPRNQMYRIDLPVSEPIPLDAPTAVAFLEEGAAKQARERLHQLKSVFFNYPVEEFIPFAEES